MPRRPNGAGPGEFLYTPQLTQINVSGLYQVT